MKVYNKNYIKIINNNLQNIQSKGLEAKSKLIEPTIYEYKKVIEIILKFIKEKKRIIYGGKCWEALLKYKNKQLKIYNDYEKSDYEFYSFEPLKDLKELCDILAKDFSFVEGAVAQHDETFKIRVNYFEYCDITYMPKIIFDKMPKMNIEGLIYSGFNFIMIDILRIFNDPLSSYWRIEKNGKRALMLFEYYRLLLDDSFKSINYDLNISEFIRKNVIEGSKLITIGYYAFNYYKQMSTNKVDNLYVPYYEVISTNLIKDADDIFEKLSKNFKNLKKKFYHPFYQFFDRKVVILQDNKILMVIYGNNEKCIPYKFLEKKNINIVLMYLLINSLYYKIYDNKEKKNIDYLIKNLIELRNNYLEKNNKTPLDNTPFQEFFIQCLGDTYDTQIRFFKTLDKRNTKFYKKNKIGRYHPGVTKNFDYEKINFKNTSGKVKN